RDGVRTWVASPEEQLQQRVTLTVGGLASTILSCADTRSLFLLMGTPLRTAGEIAGACQPGEILVDQRFARVSQGAAKLETVAGGMMRLTQLPDENDRSPVSLSSREGDYDPRSLLAFVPRVVVDRSKAGHAAWLAEFRVLSVMYIRLPDLAGAGDVNVDRLQMLVDTISEAARPLGLEIFDLVADDKGIIAEIVCGLPPFSHEDNASRALEGALRIRSMLAVAGVSCPIGVATGRVFCGEVGTAARRE